MKKILSSLLVLTLALAAAPFAGAQMNIPQTEGFVEPASYSFNSDYRGEVVRTEPIGPQLARFGAAVGVPARYDPRALGLTTPIKNQGNIGTCWAFGVTAALESLVRLQTGRLFDFSEQDMRLQLSYADTSNASLAHVGGRAPTGGGNTIMAGSYYSNFLGPNLESDAPYSTSSSAFTNAAPELHVTEFAHVFTEDDVKAKILSQGGVTASIWAGDGLTATSYSSYVKKDNANGGGAFYYNGADYNNHLVELIGWDDNYSASNFTVNPGRAGAWLAKNSWGTSSVGSDYLWISYADYGIWQNNHVVQAGFIAEGFGYIAQTRYDVANEFVKSDYGYMTSLFGYVAQTVGLAKKFHFDAGDAITDVSVEIFSQNVSAKAYIKKYTTTIDSKVVGVDKSLNYGPVLGQKALHNGVTAISLDQPYNITEAGDYLIYLELTTTTPELGILLTTELKPAQADDSSFIGAPNSATNRTSYRWDDISWDNSSSNSVKAIYKKSAAAKNSAKSGDYNKSTRSQAIALNGNKLVAVTSGSSLLLEGVDYSWNGSEITVSAEFAAAHGEFTLVASMSAGMPLEIVCEAAVVTPTPNPGDDDEPEPPIPDRPTTTDVLNILKRAASGDSSVTAVDALTALKVMLGIIQ